MNIISSNISDHNLIKVTLESSITKGSTYTQFEIKKRNTQKINKMIFKLKTDEIKSCEELSKTIENIIDRNIDIIKIKRKYDCPWINQNIIKEIRKRNKFIRNTENTQTTNF